MVAKFIWLTNSFLMGQPNKFGDHKGNFKNQAMETLQKRLTYNEFREWEYADDDRLWYELIDGKLVGRKTPNLDHQRISSEIMRVLHDFTSKTKAGEVLHAPLDVVLDDYNAFQPDLLFVKKERHSLFEKEIAVFGAPDLIVEILWKDTAFFDRGVKKDTYEKHGVREYWLADPSNKALEIYAHDGQRFKLMQYAAGNDTVKSIILEGLEFKVEDIFQIDF